jgi:hypothetical protein
LIGKQIAPVERVLVFRGRRRHWGGNRGGIITVSRGADFRDDDFDVVFERNRARREDLNWVDDGGFGWSGGECPDCGGLEYSRIILRLERGATEGGDFQADIVTERL